jgi:hypothetical protein
VILERLVRKMAEERERETYHLERAHLHDCSRFRTGPVTSWNRISHDRDRENGKSREGERLQDKHGSTLTCLVVDWIAVKEKAEELATW